MIDLSFVVIHAVWIAAAAALLAALGLQRWAARATPGEIPRSVNPVVARIAAAEPLAVVLIAPALLLPTPTRVLAAAVMPIVWWCNRRATRRTLPLTAFDPAIWLLLVMTGVSLWATYDVRVSLGKVAGLALGIMAFWAIARWINSSSRLAAATGAFLCAGGMLAVLGLLGTNWYGKFPLFAAAINRLPKVIRGVPGAEEGFHPNAVAGCLLLFIPLQVALLVQTRESWPRRAAQAVLLALTAGTLLLTQSRGAWTGVLIATLAFLAWYRRSTRIVAVAFVAVLAITAMAVGPRRIVDLAISQSGPQMAGNVSGRVELWSRAIYAIRDVPLTGLGLNVFRKVMPRFYPTMNATVDLDVAHAHNHLLQAALDLGLPGLVAYLAIWMTAAVLLIRTYRATASAASRAIAGGLGAGLIAHFAFSLTDLIPLGSKPGFLFWWALALTAGLASEAERAGEAAAPSAKSCHVERLESDLNAHQ